MIRTPSHTASVEPSNDIDRAAAMFRQDIQSCLTRLLPVLFVALISLTLLQGSPRVSWSMVLQTVACVIMVLAYSLRKRLSIPKSAVIVVACLYLCGISAASVLGWMPSSALGTALALIVLQIVLGCQRRYWGMLACLASYIGVGALAYVYVMDASGSWPLPSANSALPILPWILMTVSFACFAFIVLVEAEKMLQKIVVAQQFDRLAAGGSEHVRDAPLATETASLNRYDNALDQHASEVEDDNRRLRLVNRNLEMIAYALSHDLRAPLRAIEGFSRSLVEDVSDSMSEHARRDIQEIRAGVERMQRMVAQWLAFIRGDRSALRCELIDLSRLASEVAVELRSMNPDRKAAINVQPGLTTFGDAQLLRELLQNLMGNAWKFTQQNDASAVIEVGTGGNSFQTNYFIRDNGAGFPATDALKLFMPFVRLHSGAQYEGSGIGLAIARKIVDSHGGSIWAEGQPGFGATFSFTLPTPSVASECSNTKPSATDLRRTDPDLTGPGRSVFDMPCASNRK